MLVNFFIIYVPKKNPSNIFIMAVQTKDGGIQAKFYPAETSNL